VSELWIDLDLNSDIKCRLDFSRSEISVIQDEENQDYGFEVWYKMNNLYYIIKFHTVHLKFGTAFFFLILVYKNFVVVAQI
jgi:hypothetical protein